MDRRNLPSHHGVEQPAPAGREYPNETLRLLIERASCRSFAERDIPEETLQLILEVGTRAATGGNLQPYSIILIRDPAARRRLAELSHQAFVGQAPALLLFCIDWHRLGRWAELEVAPFTAPESFQHFWISFQDTVICAQNICTAADALGLGSVYIGTVLCFFRELREMFVLPAGVQPVVLLCLGYPQAQPTPRRKLGVETVVHSERYREPADVALLRAFEEKYPDRRVEITPERLAAIRDVCLAVHGEAFAERCLRTIEANGAIRAAQHYFGLHYRADVMPEDNEDLVAQTEEFGFGWFRKFEPRW
jgi:nitroreductase